MKEKVRMIQRERERENENRMSSRDCENKIDRQQVLMSVESLISTKKKGEIRGGLYHIKVIKNIM